MKTLCLFLMLASASTLAFGGARTCHTDITWNGLPRAYDLYVPTFNGTAPTVLWVMLHPTSSNPGGCGANQSDFEQSAMEALADTHNFIVLWPIALQNPASSCSTHIWEAYNLGYIWTTYQACGDDLSGADPDDSGFIAALIGQVEFGTNLNTVYVTGMSSGAFMAQRMGYEHPNLVNAVGAASGQIWAVQHGTAPPGLPPPPQSVNVLMLNGDADNTVHFCGTSGTGWGNSDFPPSDASLDYWATVSRGCSQQQLPQLCINGSVNTNVTTFTCGTTTGKTTFVREVNNPHCWVTDTESSMWTFFTGGGWQAPSQVCPNITMVAPTSGTVGTPVTITGTTLMHATSVKFNNTAATIRSNSDTIITTKVPAGATTGKISVTTPGGSGTSTMDFTVN